MTNVSYTVPPSATAGFGKTGASTPTVETTGVNGSAFELLLGSQTNSDGTTSDTLTYKSFTSDKTGSFSATAETGTGGSLGSAYNSLIASMQSDGVILDGASAAKLQGAMSELDEKSQGGATDAAVSAGCLAVPASGPIYFNGISSYQNQFVDSLVSELATRLDSTA